MKARDVSQALKQYASPKKAKFLTRFFKTAKGQYAEGDEFIGVVVPDSRRVALKFKEIPLSELNTLLGSKIHEERLVALLILVQQFQQANEQGKEKRYAFYLKNTNYINNWDLVDLSADKIVGAYLLDKKREALYTLAKSSLLWERRIAMIATFQFIKEKKEYRDTFKIADLLLTDTEDLIHKAAGWMLREVGKRASEKALIDFLESRYNKMPRTMLRYAIERFPEVRRRAYIEGRV